MDIESKRVAYSFAHSLEKKKQYAEAHRRMLRGKKLVISGFVVAVIGIVGYCIVCLGAGFNREIGTAMLDNQFWFTSASLGVMGLGTLFWLIGSFLYLIGAMDSDPDGPNVTF
ncbi:MAG: hypothetical protein M5U25_06040 [Planctomycetota bacterium]|nr:hypothetical protein [Planctomycetota bacterium]